MSKSKYRQKFKSIWLSSKDSNGDVLDEYVKPVSDDSFAATCVWCKIKIDVGSSGKTAILVHASRVKHKNVANNKKDRNPGQLRFHRSTVVDEQVI